MVHWTRKFFEYQLHHPFILIFSILVTRIATVALTYTDLPPESAKFQAHSTFIDDVGFTTDESKKAVNPPVRRRILMALMLLGIN